MDDSERRNKKFLFDFLSANSNINYKTVVENNYFNNFILNNTDEIEKMLQPAFDLKNFKSDAQYNAVLTIQKSKK